jgi:hypothetical protein
MNEVFPIKVINLAHRKDRMDAFSKTCATYNFPYVRVDAVYTPENGALGCIASHIKALDAAVEENKHAWICEDDATFCISDTEILSMVSEFLTISGDVLCLAYNSINHVDYNATFYRAFDTQTASCYIVKREFVPILRDFWKSIYTAIILSTTHPRKDEFSKLSVRRYDFYTTDQSWKLLQASHTFLIPIKRAAQQSASYSDIEKRNVNYKC